MTRKTIPAEDRFWPKVQSTGDGCWEWTGGRNGIGYGAFYLGPSQGAGLAHRYAYEAMIGPIPEGLDLDHICHNEDPGCPGGSECRHRRCVNPYHLEPVPRSENLSRGVGYGFANGRRTACVKGHERTVENTYIRPGDGKKVCRDCIREYGRRRRTDRKDTE